MRKTIVFCSVVGLILLLAFILWWQLAKLRTPEPNLVSNPPQVQKTIAPEPAQVASQENGRQEDEAHAADKPQEEFAHDGVDVFGVVKDEEGSLISRAEVKAFQGGHHHMVGEVSTKTLTDGSYSLSGLHYPSGSPYQVVASAEGYARASSKLFFISHPPERIDLTLTNGASLSGTVMDESRGAIPGATVALSRVEWNAPSVGTARATDSNGAYVFKDLLTGEYRLSASADGFIGQRTDITIASRETRRTQDVLLEYAGEGYCSGVVLDENDQPLEGVIVGGSQSKLGASLTGSIYRWCYSYADGSFLLEGFVAKGSDGSELPIMVNASMEGYETPRTTVYAGDEGIVIRLLRKEDLPGSISGRVVEKAKRGSLLPITEFQVEVLRMQSTLIAFRHFQSHTGDFLFPDIAEGTYDLRISAQNRATHFQGALIVKSGEETSAGLIRLAREATITGKVRGKGELETLAGAMVYIYGEKPGHSLQILTGTSTDETGFYRLEGVPPGSNYVLAGHPDYATGVSPEIEVDEGREYSNIDLVLGSGGAIEGRVTDGGIPLAGQIVSIRPSSYPDLTGRRKSLGPFIRVRTDENGYYHKDGLMPGLHFCHAYIPGRGPDVRVGASSIHDYVEVVEGKTTRFDINLCTGSGSVEGELTSEVPIPPEVTGVQIELSPSKAGDANTTAAKARGTSTSVGSSYSIDGLCPGEYSIRTSVFWSIPGGSRIQDIPCRLNPPGKLVVHAGRVTEIDVILITYE